MKTKPFTLHLFYVPLMLFLLNLLVSRSAVQSLPSHWLQEHSPLMFIENINQFDKQVRFQVQGRNGTLWLTDEALWLTLLFPDTALSPGVSERHFPDTGSETASSQDAEKTHPLLGVNIQLTFVGADRTPQLEPFDPLTTSINYFNGPDQSHWHTQVPVWGGVRYLGLYPDVDLELHSESGQIIPRLVCYRDCQSALQQVRLRITGADALYLAEGQMVIATPAGEYILPPFTAYMADRTTPITLNLVPDWENHTVTFRAATLSSPLTTTLPNNFAGLVYGTFLGSSSVDNGTAIGVDGLGNAYVTGATYSADFPTTPGTFDPTYNGVSDIFVVKLNETGNALDYATFLGGSLNDIAESIAIDANGGAYITGYTESADFPTTPGAFDTTHNGGYYDTFAVKLNPTGSNLAYATFLGGEQNDEGYGIVVDQTGNTYVAGYTSSGNFPTTPGVFSPAYNGGSLDAFVVKLNPSGSALAYATFLGSSDTDGVRDIITDEAGDVFVTGVTFSTNFPTTPGAYDRTFNGIYDTFVVKFNSAGTALTYGTFLGGSHNDFARSIALDGAGNAYISGETNSVNFPTTPGAFDPTTTGAELDNFVVKLNSAGTALTYGTFLGGSSNEEGSEIAVDEAGHVYIVGQTHSEDFPTTPNAFDISYNGEFDVFMAKFNLAGSGLDYATYLGNAHYDSGLGIDIDERNSAYLTGFTESADFPSTPGAFDPVHNGGISDGFVAKLPLGSPSMQADFSASPTQGTVPLAVNFINLATGNFDACLWDFGDGTIDADCNDPTHLYASGGIYTVALTVSGLEGTVNETKIDYITVEPNQLFLPLMKQSP